MIRRFKKKGTGKVRNATRVTLDGIKFRSKLEAFCYTKFKEAKIPVEYEKKRFTMIPKFEYKGEKIRAMTYKPDFTGDGFLVECKGAMTDGFKPRWKIFQYTLFREGIDLDLYMPRNQGDVLKVIEQIKRKIDEK